MQRSKKLALLLVLLGLVCVAALIAMHAEEKQEEIETSGETVLAIDSDTVTALSWTYDDASFSFQKEEDVWQYAADQAFPVSEDEIYNLLAQFSSFGAAFVIENVTDYAQYGLEDPTCTITITTQDETTYDIRLGAFSQVDQQRYVSLGDGKVYLAASDPLEVFDVTLSDLIENDRTLSYDHDQVTAVSFTGAANYSFIYEADSDASYRDSDVYFTQQNGETVPLDTDRVTAYLDHLSALDLTDYVTYNATEADLAAYGLDEPTLTVTVTQSYEGEDESASDQDYVLSLSCDTEALAQAQEAENAGEEAETVTGYLRVGQSNIIYEISSSDCENLLAATYNDLRHREVLPAAFDDIRQLDITLDGESYTLLTEDGETWTCNDQEISAGDLESALENLSAESADSFTDDSSSAGKEELSLTAHLNREDEAKVTMTFYRQDGSTCLAQVDGAPFALVARADVVDLIEAINAIVLD